MFRRIRFVSAMPLAAALAPLMVMLPGCPSGGDPGGNGGALPDFSLADINPNSARFNQPVSPRDYLGQVSAWYFGHAT